MQRKIVECDFCGRQANMLRYDSLPERWIHITLQLGVKDAAEFVYIQRSLCPDCTGMRPYIRDLFSLE